MSNWPTVKLGDVCEKITKGTTPTSIGHKFVETGINFLKVESFLEDGSLIPEKVAHISSKCHDSMKRSQLKEGDVLFSIAGALGRVAIVSKEMLPANTNQAFAIIRLSDQVQIDTLFLKFCLLSDIVIVQFKSMVKATAQPNLSLQNISDISIPLPPLAEQRAIVARLEKELATADKVAALARRAAETAAVWRKAILKEAFQ